VIALDSGTATAVVLAATGYFVVWNALQILMAVMATIYLRRQRLRQTQRARALASHLSSPPRISIVVPAFNEGLTIVNSVRALLALEYESEEVVVVNDGSSDDTLAVLQREFQLVVAPVAFAQPLPSAPVRAVYRSLVEPDLLVVDKVNGGSKADATNAGINVASGVGVLVIDADTVLEPDSLSRAILPFLEDPDVVAVGGNVAIINGCRVDAGRIAEVTLPRRWLARFQIVEYMRAFLLFRLASAQINAVVIISGAFGLFRRDALIEVGGYDLTAIGEDMDLTIRLHRHFRALKKPIRIAFDPHPLGWTQAPEDFASLRGQRYRWRRGLMQVMWRHRRMLSPRYGTVGLMLAYVFTFEGLAPLLELGIYIAAVVAVALGVREWQYLAVLLGVPLLLSISVTLMAVLLSDIATRRYLGGSDLVTLVAAAILESVGYHQMNSWWSCVGTFQAMTGKGGWGVMKRRAFDTLSARAIFRRALLHLKYRVDADVVLVAETRDRPHLDDIDAPVTR
jgi:cellulose synthase/poly-beta-1,6-N-acetylglucosamine synthase-like glycosyltransferase